MSISELRSLNHVHVVLLQVAEYSMVNVLGFFSLFIPHL